MRLGAGDEGEGHQHGEGDREEADAGPLWPSEQPDDTDAPDHGEDGPQHDQQEGQRHRADLGGVVLRERGPHRQLRPAVRALEDEVGQRDHPRDQRSHPQPGGAQNLSRPKGEQPSREPHPQDRHEQAAVRGHARHGPGNGPPARVAAQGAQDGQDHGKPERLVQGGREQQVAEHQRQRGEGVAPRGQGLGATLAAQLTRQQGDEHDRQGGGQRCGQAQRPRLVDHPRHGPGEERHERGLVDVPPGRGEHPEVQLVTVVAVAHAAQAQRDGLSQGRSDDGAPRQWRAGRPQRGRGHRRPTQSKAQNRSG